MFSSLKEVSHHSFLENKIAKSFSKTINKYKLDSPCNVFAALFPLPYELSDPTEVKTQRMTREWSFCSLLRGQLLCGQAHIAWSVDTSWMLEIIFLFFLSYSSSSCFSRTQGSLITEPSTASEQELNVC